MGRYLWVSMMSICVYIHAALTVLSHGCCIYISHAYHTFGVARFVIIVSHHCGAAAV